MTRRGFTLMEVLVSVVIFGIVLGVLLVSFLVSKNTYVSSDAYVRIQQEARHAFDNMVKELHQAGRVNNNVAIAAPGVQRIDFQVVRAYDAVACGGNCWGTDDAALPNGWIHYVLDTANAQNARLMRCVTAARLDPMPGGFAGCRVLANYLNPALASTAFTYDHANRIVTMALQPVITSSQLVGGSLTTASPLTMRVRLRN